MGGLQRELSPSEASGPGEGHPRPGRGLGGQGQEGLGASLVLLGGASVGGPLLRLGQPRLGVLQASLQLSRIEAARLDGLGDENDDLVGEDLEPALGGGIALGPVLALDEVSL